MKLFFTGLLISFSFLLTAQQTLSKFDVRIGTGISSNNDLALPYLLNNQLNYRLNNYITLSTGITFGRSGSNVERESFRQLHLNAFVSPLKNNGRHDIRLGGGVSRINSTRIVVHAIAVPNLNSSSRPIENAFSDHGGSIISQPENLENRYGFNVIGEYSFRINKKFLIGSMIQWQEFYDGRYRQQILVKLGMRL